MKALPSVENLRFSHKTPAPKASISSSGKSKHLLFPPRAKRATAIVAYELVMGTHAIRVTIDAPYAQHEPRLARIARQYVPGMLVSKEI